MKKISLCISMLCSLFFIADIHITPAQADTLILRSKTIHTGVPFIKDELGFSHGGQNESPDLHWTSIKAARSYAVTIYDRNAHEGRGFWHWIALNIPASATELQLNASAGHLLPLGTQEFFNSRGKAEYVGPTPPPGTGVHHYVTTIYALNTPHIAMPTNVHNLRNTQDTLVHQLQDHSLCTAAIVPIASATDGN